MATMDVIREEHLLENADKVGTVMLEGLRDIQARRAEIREVRGLALMIGIELADHDVSAAVERRAFEKGMLMLGCGEASVRMSPPLNFREDQARTALGLFEETLAEVEAGA